MKFLMKSQCVMGTLIVAFSTTFFSCKQSQPASQDAALRFEGVIPRPVSATTTGKTFFLTSETRIVADPAIEGSAEVAQYLGALLRPATGFDLPVESASNANGKNLIYLAGANDTGLGAEGYEMAITEDQIKIAANESAGLFYGIQTLRQLLPEAIERSELQQVSWEVATGTIRDYPQFEWRGAMLDVARHFFGVDDVKRYIDLITSYKMNRLHLHLSDDQGWRIEIKSWPRLATHGGSSSVGGGKGGYYTQEQYTEIVQYAADRFVTIVPEIDMPGHTNAALASYGELNANGKPTELYTGIEVGFSTLQLNKDVTFKFVDDVLRELSSLTPGPYLHIGGDEAHVTKKEDYIQFINRFAEIVKKYNKRMVGWEDIAQADLDANAIAQHWHSNELAAEAVRKNAKVIMSPASRIYIDMQYDSTTKLGLHWAGYVEVDHAYDWDPLTLVPGLSRENILGVEAPLWTETLTTIDEVEYMAFPRLPGVAELAWTPSERRGWDEYKVRLGNHAKRMQAKGIDFYESPRVPWVK
jgi:hexosaminidase